MRKKIVIDGVIFGLQKAGGISRMWADSLLGLDQTVGAECDLYLLLPKNKSVEWLALSSQLKNIKVLKRKRLKWGKRSFFRDSLYLTWIALRLRPHIWHTTYYSGLPFLFGGKKFVTFHDMIPEKFGFATSYETQMKYKALKTCDQIITISENSKRDLIERWNEFSKKVAVIYCCACESVLKNRGKSDYFLFVGKRGGYKNFLPAARAILQDRRFDPYKIKVVGGEEELSFEEKALGQRVEFLGIKPFHEVQELIQGAFVLLFPSLYEGFGIPVLEAFVYEVPVLAMRTSSIPEITGTEYPLADPNETKTLSNSLSELISHREKWIEYGKERTKLFRHESMVNKLINEYALFNHHNHF